MTRVLLQYLLPLLAPLLLYLGWVWLGRRKADKGEKPWWEEGPWFWLVLAGVLLMGAGLAVEALLYEGKPGDTYIAPHMEDGRIAPGRFE